MFIKIFNNNLYKNYILFVVFLLPLLPLLNILIPKFGLIKEITVFGYIIIFMSIYNFHNLIEIKNTNFSIIIVYYIYIIMHVFISTVSVESAFLGLKYHVIPLFLATILIVLNFNKPLRLLYIFLILMLCSNIIVDIIGIIEYFKRDIITELYGGYIKHTNYRDLQNARLVSTLANPINLGVFLIIATLSAYTLLSFVKSYFIKSIVLIIILINIFIIIFTLSRSSYIGLFILLLGYVFSSKKRFLYLIILFSILISFNIINFSMINIFEERLSDMSFSYMTTDLRIVNWYGIISNFFKESEFLFFGRGLGTLGWTAEGVLSENMYLGIFLELGLFGIILFLFILLMFLKNILVILKIDKNIGYLFLNFLIIFMVLGIFMDIHINLQTSFYFWFMILISELIVRKYKIDEKNRFNNNIIQ